MNMATMADMAHKDVKSISGKGSSISATSEEKIVTNRAMTLTMPMVVVLKTIGNKSICPTYKIQPAVLRPAFITKRQAGTRYLR